jgi:hypothetical protein
MLEDAGIDPQQVDLAVVFPLLEGASLQSDDDLIDRYAALLANAAAASRAFPRIRRGQGASRP